VRATTDAVTSAFVAKWKTVRFELSPESTDQATAKVKKAKTWDMPGYEKDAVEAADMPVWKKEYEDWKKGLWPTIPADAPK
jgi:hypothetical protein